MRPALDDTIAAIATPLGEGGLGVVRLSGRDALAIAAGLFESARPLSAAASHTLHHGWIAFDGRRLDEAVVGVFRAPTSYTGEDVVEFSCHGSPAVLKELLARCLESGARLAKPGEFTERAYLNGRLDLAQAEAVAALIAARSAKAARSAADQLAGGLSRRVDGLRSALVDLLAEVEANLDFSEEDIPNIDVGSMTRRLDAWLADIDALLATSVRGRWLREGARVALAGRPNAGKSSLFNALLAQDRAIVTDVPGTTRDTLEESLTWDGYPLTLIDTAGLRATDDPVESIGAGRARQAQARADVVVWVIDGSRPLSVEDEEIAHALAGRAVVPALNKCDEPRVLSAADLQRLGAADAAPTSALTGEGLADLRARVVAALPGDGEDPDGVVITNERHAERLLEARASARNALDALGGGRTEEAVASDLRKAAESLAAITGLDVGEAVLDSIFRRFCIGK